MAGAAAGRATVGLGFAPGGGGKRGREGGARAQAGRGRDALRILRGCAGGNAKRKRKETGVGIKAAGDHGMSYSSRYFLGTCDAICRCNQSNRH